MWVYLSGPFWSAQARGLAALGRPSFANDPPSRLKEGRREDRALAAPMARLQQK
jgi:hypothetical protein